jgi:hypothetical protein
MSETALSRRKFLISSGFGITALAAADPLKTLTWTERGKEIFLADQTLEIYRPLVLKNLHHAILRNLRIITMPGFVGASAIGIDGSCSHLEFRDIFIDGKNIPLSGSAIFLHGSPPPFLERHSEWRKLGAVASTPSPTP